MSGDEVVRHEKRGPREAFFHGRSISDRCDVCILGEFGEECLRAVEGARIVKPSEIGPVFDGGWNAAVEFIAARIQQIREKHSGDPLPAGYYRTHGGLIAGPDSAH